MFNYITSIITSARTFSILASPKPPSPEQRRAAAALTPLTKSFMGILQSSSPRTLILAITLVLSLILAISARVSAQDSETAFSSSDNFAGRSNGRAKRSFLSSSSTGGSTGAASAPMPMMAAPDMMTADASFASPPQMMKMGMDGARESFSSNSATTDMAETVSKMREAGLSSTVEPAKQGVLIHRSGFITMESMNVAKATEMIKKQVVDVLGGYEESTSSSEDQWLLQRWEDYRKAMVQAGKAIAKDHEISIGPTHSNLNFRVPSEKFEDARTSIRRIASDMGGKVLNENSNGVDVTESYVDVVARQTVDTKALSQLNVLLTAATSVNDVLNIKREMDHINARLESLAGQRKSLEGRAAMSSLSASIQLPQPPQVPQPTPRPPPIWSAGGVFIDAFTSLGGFAKFGLEVTIYTAVFSVPIAIVVGAVYFAIKSATRS